MDSSNTTCLYSRLVVQQVVDVMGPVTVVRSWSHDASAIWNLENQWYERQAGHNCVNSFKRQVQTNTLTRWQDDLPRCTDIPFTTSPGLALKLTVFTDESLTSSAMCCWVSNVQPPAAAGNTETLKDQKNKKKTKIWANRGLKSSVTARYKVIWFNIIITGLKVYSHARSSVRLYLQPRFQWSGDAV